MEANTKRLKEAAALAEQLHAKTQELAGLPGGTDIKSDLAGKIRAKMDEVILLMEQAKQMGLTVIIHTDDYYNGPSVDVKIKEEITY